MRFIVLKILFLILTLLSIISCDSNSNKVVYIECEYVERDENGLILVKKNEKFGLINERGEEIAPCIYDFLDHLGYESLFGGGMSLVCKDDKYGIINMKGKEVVPCIYDYDEAISSIWEDEKIVCFNEKGKKITLPSYYRIEANYHEGFMAVQKDDKYGAVNEKGKEIVPCIYDEVESFHGGYAVVKKDHKFGAVNKKGKEIIPCIYDEVKQIHGGLMVIRKDDRFGVVNEKGDIIVPCIYDDCAIAGEILSLTNTDSNDFIAVNCNGKIYSCSELLKKYERVGEFHDGLAAVCKDDKYGFVNIKGREVVPCIYDDAYDFLGGLASVCKDDKYGFVNIKGEEIVPCVYDGIWEYWGGFAEVEKDNKEGVVDMNGEEVVPCVYDEVVSLGGGYFIIYDYGNNDRLFHESNLDRPILSGLHSDYDIIEEDVYGDDVEICCKGNFDERHFVILF